MRSDPTAYDRYVAGTAGTDLVTLLTQAPLVRINRTTDEIEPWLAERWTASADGRTYTLTLRAMTFSDGVPFTSADVLFAFEAIYDDRVKSPLKSSLEVDGNRCRSPLRTRRPWSSRSRPLSGPDCGSSTTCRSFPSTSSAPLLPPARSPTSWTPGQPLDTVAGLGPFVLREHVSGNGWCSRATRTTSAATPRARRCRTSIRSRCSSRRSNDGGAAPAGRRDRPDG